MSDSKETHKASFTVQASVKLPRDKEGFLGDGCRFSGFLNPQFAIRNPKSCLLLVSKFYGQATKGTRWMPWHFEAMKDVASCEKLRLGASIL